MQTETYLENYFQEFRNNIIGINLSYHNIPNLIYIDWTASGRMYLPIEDFILKEIAPWIGNTHSESSLIGQKISSLYQEAKTNIKRHVNATANDILIPYGTGATDAVNKLQRLLGLKIPEYLNEYMLIPDEIKPVIFLSQMEHHSNHISWLETMGKVIIIPCDEEGLIDIDNFDNLLELYNERSIIVSVTACSNVTGIKTPYHQIAGITHKHRGVCFVDFACSAPYVQIDMHPNETEYLDAIFFSPHKFLGGPGSCGVLIMNKNLIKGSIPDIVGGGTVDFTSPYSTPIYKRNAEEREDGGTPGILQTIRASLAINLKEKMGVPNIYQREQEINHLIFGYLNRIPNLKILAGQHTMRLSVFSFIIEGLNYDIVVRMLSERYGIQARGGCSCAGIYGHYLLKIGEAQSFDIRNKSEHGCTTDKPGWIRISFHPTSTNSEIYYVCEAIEKISIMGSIWQMEYFKEGFLK